MLWKLLSRNSLYLSVSTFSTHYLSHADNGRIQQFNHGSVIT